MQFLKSSHFGSAVWIFGGYGASQCLRLLSNLILTRLLVPEMFGVMAVINSVLIGVSMLSDVGIRGAIINFEHCKRQSFLNTAWTMQIIKGLFIFLVIAVMAFPMQVFLQYEDLALLLIVAALTTIVSGFTSLNIYVLEKQLTFKSQIYIEIASQVIGIAIMAAVAYFYRSVWSLILGMLVQKCCHVLFSHIFLSGPKMSLGFDADDFRKIFKFGKWVFLATAATYINFHSDKIIIAKMVSVYDLGIYSMAAAFGLVLQNVIENLSWKMLLPLYRKIIEAKESLVKVLKARLLVLAVAFLGAWFLAIFGEYIIVLLFDPRYENAGWMLQLLVLAGLCHSFDDTIRPFLLANQDSYSAFCVQVFKSITFLLLAYFLGSNFGLIGILFSIILAPLLTLPFLAYYVSKYHYRWLYLDGILLLVVFACFLGVWKYQDSTVWNNLVSVLV